MDNKHIDRTSIREYSEYTSLCSLNIPDFFSRSVRLPNFHFTLKGDELWNELSDGPLLLEVLA